MILPQSDLEKLDIRANPENINSGEASLQTPPPATGTHQTTGAVMPVKAKSLKDIAELAGVTAAAVSLALRNSPKLSDELKVRIQQLAAASGFKPRSYRKRRTAKPAADAGDGRERILLINSENPELNPVVNTVLPKVTQLSETLGFRLGFCQLPELLENPALLDNYAGVIYYNDPPGLVLPEKVPAVQIFGWLPENPTRRDRVTANDSQVVELAVRHLTGGRNVTHAVMAWRPDMLVIPEHPRISGFIRRMREKGCQVLPLAFGREDESLHERIGSFLGETPVENAAFFGFNSVCGLKLCCALDRLGIFGEAVRNRAVLVCDNSQLLKGFWPPPALIDLNLPLMAERAIEALLWRLRNPGAPGAVILQEARLLTSEMLIGKE